MKKQLLKLSLFGILMGFSGTIAAQDFVDKKITNENGSISLVVFKANSGMDNASAADIFNQILKLKPKEELRLLKSETDFTGNFVDKKYQFFLNNIKVDGALYNIHYKNGKLSSMNGEIFRVDSTPTRAEISATTAFNEAVKNVGAQKYMWQDEDYIANNEYKKPTGELVYLPVDQGNGTYNLTLAYKFDIYAAEPLSRAYIYVDAIAGRIAGIDPIMKHASNGKNYIGKKPISIEPYQQTVTQFPTLVAGTAATRYSGSQSIETTLNGSGKYILHDTTRGNGVHTYNSKKGTSYAASVDFEDNDNNWTAAEFDNALFDNAGLDAHWGVEKTYDYFKDTFNRSSYDGLGTLLKSYVHYRSAYENAGWTGSEMIYGDGATTFHPLTALDVTGHELGHGVCSSSAALVYNREPGALNEALSDIWGATVEYTAAPTKQYWLIGEDITKVAPGYLRSMSNPKSGLSPQPDTYHGINWKPATVAEGCITPSQTTNDYCGVHYNSGVIAHWFYILSVGKTGTNDIGHSYSVTGITIQKAAKIAYRLETNYLTATSDFIAARNFGIQAAKDLYGVDSPEAIATQDAFYAVGLGAKYLVIPDTTAPTAPSNLNAINTTGTQTKLQWTAATDDNGIEKYNIFKDGVALASVAGNVLEYQVTGLTKNTTYNFYVKAEDPYTNISSASNTVAVTTLNVNTYCTVNSSNTADEKIKRVQFGTIDNSSTGTAGYEDFTYLSTDVTKGQTYPISITPDWSGTIYNEAYTVFVDWNNDGDFDDAGETALTIAGTQTTPATGNIVVPNTYPYVGSVRMRVILKYSTAATSACGTINYGQIEDYSLNVIAATLAVNENALAKATVYPNPVKDVITIQSKVSGEISYKIFSTAGQLVSKGNTFDKKINAQKLPVGSYILEMIDKEGTKTNNKFIKK